MLWPGECHAHGSAQPKLHSLKGGVGPQRKIQVLFSKEREMGAKLAKENKKPCALQNKKGILETVFGGQIK